MLKSLVIVESPAKARTLGKYLGKGFDVVASVGHVKDLPKKSLGVAIEKDFEPEYEIIHGKKKVILDIRKRARDVDVVYVASDPDREGEAIAWHVRDELMSMKGGPKDYFRVLITEITKRGVEHAFSQPLSFDEAIRRNLFDAQQARRILDRLVGYQISPILWRKVQGGLSAGRVQSVAVQFVVDRERAIRSFVAEEYWNLQVTLSGSLPPPFVARVMKKDGKKIKVPDQAAASRTAAELKAGRFVLAAIERRRRARHTLPPFITSKLQQEASRKLRFSAKHTMSLAQRLYEGVDVGSEGPVGLITYMRTDSVRISPEALDETRGYIRSAYGEDYAPAKPNVFSNKKNIQDAHEAIRPTSVLRSPDKVRQYLKDDEYRLYDLIWKRFVASQMTPAQYDQTTFDIKNGPYALQTQADVLVFPGFLTVYEEGMDADGGDNGGGDNQKLPPLKEGEDLALVSLDTKQQFTQPPPRYTEATLVKELEEKGIGRPSTYAAILSTIVDKDYVAKEQGKFKPTELGELVTDLLKESFPQIMDVAFTAEMENRLDEVEEGGRQWRAMLKDFYDVFEPQLSSALAAMRNVRRESIPTEVPCPSCGALMAIKWGKRGSFLACSAYPECKTTLDYIRDYKGVVQPVMPVSDLPPCPKCGGALAVKNGRFGRFISCSNYPTCDYRAPFSLNVPCPREGCAGNMVEKRSKRGKVFYGCNQYPACDFATWNEPVARKCSNCGAASMVKLPRGAATTYRCEICKHQERDGGPGAGGVLVEPPEPFVEDHDGEEVGAQTGGQSSFEG